MATVQMAIFLLTSLKACPAKANPIHTTNRRVCEFLANPAVNNLIEV